MSISPVKLICNSANWLASRKFIEKGVEKAFNDPAKYAAGAMVLSIVSKDLVGCALYTSQSWTNKKIPEDKRKFVASVDLMNGIVMVGGQLFIGKVIDGMVVPKWFGALFTGVQKDKNTGKDKPIDYEFAKNTPYNDDMVNLRGEKAIESLSKKHVELQNLSGKQREEICAKLVKEVGRESKKAKAIATGFGIVVTALATTAMTKRTLAPLISTPMAAWFENKFLKKGKKAHDNSSDKKEVVKSNNPDDVLLSHTVAPWNQNAGGDTFKKVISK